MQPKIRRLIMPKAKVAGSIVALVILVVLSLKFFSVARGFWQQFVVPVKSTDNRTNVLLLGIPGGSHAGADLTDTIMVLSFHHLAKTLSLISLPRDIWSDTLKDKINSAYHYGEEKKPGGGLVLAKVVAEDVVGLPIHYGLVIDFSGFRQLVDLVGGMEVTVTWSFTDTEFPIAGKEDDPCKGDPKLRCRYETIHFEAGTQHMDGATALKYIRSRHAANDEGSDFSRSRRQQEVLLAIRQKLTAPSTWLSLRRIQAIPAAFDAATNTDMKVGELLTFGKLISRVQPGRIQRIPIEEQLTTPPLWLYGGKYVLVPKEDFAGVHEYIKSQLD